MGGWRVPSQSSTKTYVVNPAEGSCTCPDYELHEVECKHILAVKFTMKREGGNRTPHTVTKTVEVKYTRTGRLTTLLRLRRRTGSLNCSLSCAGPWTARRRPT